MSLLSFYFNHHPMMLSDGLVYRDNGICIPFSNANPSEVINRNVLPFGL